MGGIPERKPLTPDDPRHGHYAGWHAHHKQGIPACDPCLEARRRYQKGLAVDHDRGYHRKVPIGPARRYVRKLHEAGLPYKQIAELAGVSPRSIYAVAGFSEHYRSTLVTIRVASQIMAIQIPEDTPPLGYLPRLGVARRIQALVALGWSPTEISEQSGIGRPNVSSLMHGGYRPVERSQKWVQAKTFKRVDDVYRRICMIPGTSDRAKKLAAKHGWAPPLAWDDIDDPEEFPSLARPSTKGLNAIQLSALATQERREQLQHLNDLNATLDQVLEELRISKDALWKWCRRQNHDDLWEQISRRTRSSTNQHAERNPAA